MPKSYNDEQRREISLLKSRTKSDYPYHLTYRTRWSDNDQYGHINNSIYNHLIDSIVNTYLITHCGLVPFPTTTATTATITSPPTSKQIGLVPSSHTHFFSPCSFPSLLTLGLAVTHIGHSSVTYEVGFFEGDDEQVRAVGGFTHVFVEREGAKLQRGGLETGIREGLERILVKWVGGVREKAKL